MKNNSSKFIPVEIVTKIMMYNSHPVADVFKKSECYNSHCSHFDVEDFTVYWQEVYRPMVGKHKSYKE